MTGTPFSAGKRLQFNLDVVPIPEVEMMKGMRKMVFPTFWIEEGANLPPAFTDPLKKMFLCVPEWPPFDRYCPSFYCCLIFAPFQNGKNSKNSSVGLHGDRTAWQVDDSHQAKCVH